MKSFKTYMEEQLPYDNQRLATSYTPLRAVFLQAAESVDKKEAELAEKRRVFEAPNLDFTLAVEAAVAKGLVVQCAAWSSPGNWSITFVPEVQE